MPSSSPDPLLALKPRQVLLSQNMAGTEKSNKATLLAAIARFLERNAFNKTLRKFRTEAQLQGDDTTALSLDLEEMYRKYLEICRNSSTASTKEKNEGEETGIGAGAEIVTDKRKKRSEDINTHTSKSIEVAMTNGTVAKANAKFSLEKKSGNGGDVDQSKQVESEAMNESSHNIKKQKVKKEKNEMNIKSSADNRKHHPKLIHGEQEERSKDAVVSDTEKDAKRHKKKQNKLTSDSVVDNVEQNCVEGNHEASAIKANGNPSDKESGKTEENKKKKRKDGTILENFRVDDSKMINNMESKGSKKRKRHDSGENKSEKTEEATELSASAETVKLACEENERENYVVGVDSQKSAAEQLCASANGGHEENGKGSAMRNTEKRRKIGSVEPKKPFQRVNVDEVKFVDERLKDNSYWAKDGAEKGFGAKAQEILGQVRGRDFRHEKTKKKRGTYRGGMIDFGSHSIKFNYSDDE